MDMQVKVKRGVCKSILYDLKMLQAMGRRGAAKKFGAQLPSHFFLMISRVFVISSDGGVYGKGFGVAEYDVNPRNIIFRVHFADRPILPAVMLLEGVQQFTGLAGWHLGCKGQGVVKGAGGYEVHKLVLPGAGTLRCKIDIKRLNTRRMPHFIVADGEVVNEQEETVFTVDDLKIAFVQS